VDKLNVLVTLVETYEERCWPLRSRRRFDPVDMLHDAIVELGHSQAELAEILGSRSRASEVAAPLALAMIQGSMTAGKFRPIFSFSPIVWQQRVSIIRCSAAASASAE
jgi:HTH-type transcriptional regulator / antitoxin HigA